MASRATSRLRVVLSVLGVIIAFALAVAAVCLIAFGTTHKTATLGALAGVWSALLAYLSIYGVRRHPVPPPEILPERLSAASELELARSREVESTRDAKSRREYEERLQALVQSELANISETMNSQLHALRDQVAELRGELVEKVGGQLRLERVETTRVIGSNIEALQHEVRRLAVGRDDVSLLSRSRPNAIDVEPARPLAAVPDPVEPAPVPPTPTPPVAAPPPVALAQPVAPPPPPAASPAPVAPAAAVTAPAAEPVRFDADPFAGLPRLSRFTDDADANETRELPAVARRSRHAVDDQPKPDSRPSGGRRRRSENEPNDILQRLLESHN